MCVFFLGGGGAPGPGMAINGFLGSWGFRCTEYRQNPGSGRPFRGQIMFSKFCSQKTKPLCLCASFAPNFVFFYVFLWLCLILCLLLFFVSDCLCVACMVSVEILFVFAV